MNQQTIELYAEAIDHYSAHLDSAGVDRDRLLLELIYRMDGKGDGKPCGGGWISKRKKCSKKSLKRLTADLKAGDKGAIARVRSGKKKAAARQKLTRQVEADKGKKARDIVPKTPKKKATKEKAGLSSDQTRVLGNELKGYLANDPGGRRKSFIDKAAKSGDRGTLESIGRERWLATAGGEKHRHFGSMKKFSKAFADQAISDAGGTPKPPTKAKKKAATKKKAAAKAYSGASHPKKWEGKGDQDRYRPKEWQGKDGVNYTIGQNKFGQYWPLAHYAKENGKDGTQVFIRASNPFKSFGGATKYVEKTIQESDKRSAARAAKRERQVKELMGAGMTREEIRSRYNM